MLTNRVVLIMPVYNEARHLSRVLRSIGEQTFDRSRMFFIAVDGASTDGSADMLRRWLVETGFPGCVLTNPMRKIAISLNLALRETTAADVIVRLDAHSEYGPTYVAQAVAALERAPADVACVGGAQIPVPGTTFEHRVVEALYTNPLGLGGADFRLGNDTREVDSVYLGTWRPGILRRSGGFNELMEANEDAELAARLRAMGYRLLRVPLPCRFIINRGIWASIRQWNRYGYWRAKMLKLHPERARLRHVASPPLALIAFGLLFSPLRLVLAPALALYALAIACRRSRGEPPIVTLATIAFFPVLQLAFAAGMLRGFLSAPVPASTFPIDDAILAGERQRS